MGWQDAPVIGDSPAPRWSAAPEMPSGSATTADRIQAGEGGFLKGAAYLAALPADTAVNLFNLGRAGIGSAYRGITGKDIPGPLQGGQEVSPVGGWLSRQMDKSPITTTQPTRPDDTISRYIGAAGSVIPGAITGGGGLGSVTRGIATAVPGAMAGQYVAEKKPFQSDAANNAASIAAQLLVTGMMPRGKGQEVPGFEEQNQAVKDAQEKGFVFPPATTNPTAGNRMVESVAGKQNIQQHASIINQKAANATAREEIGLPASATPISESDLAMAKGMAAPGYDAIRSAGQIDVTPQFASDIDSALSKLSGASKLAGALKDPKISTIADQLKSNSSFDAADGIDTIRTLRDSASEAYRGGNSGLGAAYKGLSRSIEDAIEQHLGSQGGPSQDILDGYKASRQMFAKINSVEDAINPTTGNVVAGKLGTALKNGAPLSGGLKTIAQAYGRAPNAFKEPTTSAGVNHLGLIGALMGGGAMAMEHFDPDHHLGLAPFAAAAAIQGARTGARKWALNPGLGMEGLQGNLIPLQKPPLSAAQIGAFLSSRPGILKAQ